MTPGHHRRPALAALTVLTVLTAAGAGLLSGCTPQAPDPGRFVGDALDVAMAQLHSPNVIDLSEPILGVDASYAPDDDDADWLVVVACYAPNAQQTSDVAVIPKAAATAEIRAAAKRGEYERYVPSCGG